MRLSGLLGPSHLPNCGITQVSVISGRPFKEVFEWVKKYHKHNNNWKGRTYQHERDSAFVHFGTIVERVALGAYAGRSLGRVLNILKPGVTYAVDVTGHAIVVRDGRYIDQNWDDWRPIAGNKISRKRVVRVLKVCHVFH